MLFFYQIGIKLYIFLIKMLSPFDRKAQLWLKGRKKLLHRIQLEVDVRQTNIWFHFASLGEFEQGVPVLKLVKKKHPQYKIIITFFSPSGYEVRKNSALADHVYYLPADTAANARAFVKIVNPTFAVFTKYEYWYYFFKELKNTNIPIYIISGIFREQQNYFKWYGTLNRKTLGFVSHFFVQDEESRRLLALLGHSNATVSGDTRFDRVAETAESPKQFPEIAAFCKDDFVLVAGSTWPQDEKLIAGLVKRHPDWKFIIAPHETDGQHIANLTASLPAGSFTRYTALAEYPLCNVLIIDTIGILSSVYQYGKAAYIGGGFSAGIHNTLEAAVFGIPLVFGPEFKKFQEAIDLVECGAAYTVRDEGGLQEIMVKLHDKTTRTLSGAAAKHYVEARTGASALIIDHLFPADDI